MKQFDYPALFITANDASASSQRLFLNLVRAEYALLVVAALFSMNFYPTAEYFVFPTLVLVGSLVVLIFRSLLKPEQSWYRGRALAESIKTSSWKYCMRGEPFGDADDLKTRREEFRAYLTDILLANRLLGDRMPADQAAAHQVTPTMEETRGLPLVDRIKYYDRLRIQEQREWYAGKAAANKAASRVWLAIGIMAYGAAIVMSLFRITEPKFAFWPIDPVIIFASCILGWMQIKKFNELASSYTLTAHEIGILQSKVGEVLTEAEFSKFVVDAEQAFSREHTQWLARQAQP